MELLITILLIMMIIGAIIALEIRDLLSSVVSIGAVGVILALAFLLLQAPDLAIVQLVVEILALIILIRATVTRDDTRTLTWQRRVFVESVAAVGILIFLYFGYLAIKQLPVFGEPIMKVAKHYLENALTETGAANIVASIILDYRGYDTLGEATVLFTAVIGVLAVMRKVGRKRG